MRACWMGLALAIVCTGTAAAAGRQIAVYNDGDFAMVGLEARLPKTKPWPIELLGKHSLGVGRTVKVAAPPGPACIYDLLAIFDDGHKQQKLAVDTCKAGTVTFSG